MNPRKIRDAAEINSRLCFKKGATMNLKKIISLLVCGSLLFSPVSFAKSAREIDASVDTAYTRFEREVPGATQLLKQSHGFLIFPSVNKAGIGIGGEYGEGALLVRGAKHKEYYNTISGSIGFQLGG